MAHSRSNQADFNRFQKRRRFRLDKGRGFRLCCFAFDEIETCRLPLMTSNQLFRAMSPTLAADILEHAFSADKEVYRATLSAIAQARKVRPVYLERQPRADRHRFMAAKLGRHGMDMVASNLLKR